MELIVLGSGTGTPNPERSSCSLLVKAANSLLLLDFGPGTMRRILEEGFSPQELDAILLSHFHLDHTLDLWAYLFAAHDEAFSRSRPVALIAPESFPGLQRAMVQVYGDYMISPPGLVTYFPARSGRVDPPELAPLLPGFSLKACHVAHKPESLAFRIEAEGASLVYSGDTDYSKDLIDLARGTDWLILEATRPDHQKLKGHLTPTLAGRLAAQARARNLLLTHLSPHHGQADPAAAARREFAGNVIAARDGMRIEL